MAESGSKTDAPNLGVIVSVRGSVVDARFEGRLPPIHSVLHAIDGQIVIEVLAQRDSRHVRGIALTPTQGLARGMPVQDAPGAHGEVFVAVDEGVLVKTGQDVLVSVRRALRGVDLVRLHDAVEHEFLTLDAQEKRLRAAMAKLETGFLRRFASFQHE